MQIMMTENFVGSGKRRVVFGCGGGMYLTDLCGKFLSVAEQWRLEMDSDNLACMVFG
jgi:hypothetical protein